MDLPSGKEPIVRNGQTDLVPTSPRPLPHMGETVEALLSSLTLPGELQDGSVRGVLRCRHGKAGARGSELAVVTEAGDVVEIDGWETSYLRGDDEVRLMCKKCPIYNCVWVVDKSLLRERIGAQSHAVETIFIEEVATSHPL